MQHPAFAWGAAHDPFLHGVQRNEQYWAVALAAAGARGKPGLGMGAGA
jgi:hypothetical protein